jgi:hypothetical protein
MDESSTPAFSAVQEAVEALGRRDPAAARIAVAQAYDRDHGSALARLADAVYLAASQLDADGAIGEATWDQLADAVGPGPLQGLVESLRG